jgi:type IV pilus assembly protein PilC
MKYAYRAYTEDRKVKSGTIEAASPQVAEEALLKNGFQHVLTLQDVNTKSRLRRNITLTLFGCNNKDILEFSRELASLLHAGISIVNALQLLEKQTSKASLKAIISDIISELRGGKALSQAISKHNKVFSKTYIAVIKAAENSGDLDTALNHVTEYLEKQEDIKKRTRRALVYPVMVLLLAIGVSGLLTTAVLPPLMGLFSSLGTDLPLTTKMIVVLSNFIMNNKYYILAALIIIPTLIAVYARFPSGKYKIDSMLLRIPLLGQIILRTNLLYFCRSFAMLLEAGGHIPNIFATCVSTVGNERMRTAFVRGEEKLLEGHPFSHAMAATELFPASSIEALVVGEQTGELDSALKNVAGYFDRTNSEKVDELISMIGPAVTIAVGLGIGFIAISIISAMYSIHGGF